MVQHIFGIRSWNQDRNKAENKQFIVVEIFIHVYLF